MELKNLRRENVIRLFDLLYIIKHQDGTIASKEVDDLQAEEQREYGTLVKSLIGLAGIDIEHLNADEVAEAVASDGDEFGLSESEIQDVAGQLADGSSAIFVVFEHSWARGVKQAMLRAGGYVRAQGMINPETLQTTTNELATVLEAIEKAETASLEKMAGIMAEAKAQEEEARSQADAAVAEADAIEAVAMAALAAAVQKEEEADKAVAEAEARAEEARQRAAYVTSEAEAMEDAAFAQAEAVRRAAKRQEEKAVATAAEVVKKSEEIEAEAVIRAVNAMVTARVIERAAAREALEAIIAADVVEAAAVREAAKALSSGR